MGAAMHAGCNPAAHHSLPVKPSSPHPKRTRFQNPSASACVRMSQSGCFASASAASTCRRRRERRVGVGEQ